MTSVTTAGRTAKGIWKGYKDLVEAAQASVTVCSVEEARSRYGTPELIFVDVRDEAELWRDGRIPGSIHASRGMLEFHIDPESPYFLPGFGAEAEFVFVSAVGDRATLAAQRAAEMGVGPVSTLEGGFRAWEAAGGPVKDAVPTTV
ncbi:rhodanese-like domain-containing protein [Haloarchaeobius sp. DFWS5]|uniref:rhodanese-like domain-containing protein n=1 Tax=Haloarchaeobius sp. DFWS5 TaxID=3446114 RepID=UPI003EB9218F